ncbi:MAG: CopG family transcriptional regulator [Pseudomonadota bacterium]
MGKLKKVPVQIYLEPEQDKIIGFLSKTTGKSKAAVIRLCISRYLDNLPPEKDPALGIMKLGASGRKDIAEKHDEYLMSFRK